jgi:hypothetical protein
LLGGFYYLEGSKLYSMIILTFLGISLNTYVLCWSYKNKIYDADLIYICSPLNSLITSIWFFLIISLKTFIYYFVLSSIFAVLIYFISNASEFYANAPFGFSLVFGGCILISAILIVCGLILEIIKMLTATDPTFKFKISKFVQQFNLNLDDTVFCSSGSDITGFISAGFFYLKDQGLIYDKVLYKSDDVISYLNSANIPLSELDTGHLKVMSMYCYA